MTSENQVPPKYLNSPYDNPEWVIFLDSESSRPYFYNTSNGDTVWDDPLQHVASRADIIEEESHTEDAIKSRDLFESAIEIELNRGVPPYLADSWRSRPARRQSDRDSSMIAYKEGSERYNIWYHRVSNDRFDESIRVAATTKCDPWLDSGFTEADSKHAESSPFCMWFAKGCCSKGERCRYKHRVPTKKDSDECDQMVDIFGRERHAQHTDHMGGVGSFLKECKSLYISEIELEQDIPDAVQKLEAQLWQLFHPWGPIENIRVIPSKRIAFLKVGYRAAAEFAKVACANQPCGKSEAINVRWAFEDPNPRAEEQSVIDTRDEFLALIEKRIAEMSYLERLAKGLIKEDSVGDASAFEERFEIP
jgi:hypothetical protein